MSKGKFNKNMYIKKDIFLEKTKGVTNDMINIFKMYKRYFIVKPNERISLIVQD